MKKMIITLAILIGFVTAAYADGAWDRVVQASESCAMVAYEIPTTPISREVPGNKARVTTVSGFARSDAKSIVSERELSARKTHFRKGITRDAATDFPSIRGPIEVPAQTATAVTLPLKPMLPVPVGGAQSTSHDQATVTYRMAVPMTSSCQPAFNPE